MRIREDFKLFGQVEHGLKDLMQKFPNYGLRAKINYNFTFGGSHNI